ncbi:MAG: protein kinase, partial [Acidobacteriota bacterium]|nr:protein kinase [Acidobacteriota bacterium]
LDREVAIKILPEAFAADRERLARFEQEAKLLASLNHPNIATVHGLHADAGVRFLAMELVGGEDLAERLERGAIPVAEATRIALEVAHALETAHENGVIHRDLKPANIRLTADGKVKVLDFGLAKAFDETVSTQTDVAMSPTMTSAGTVAGMILGTASYMSPEQAAGQPVDKRCDVWSFGVVCWELLTGRRLFEGETVSHTLADVLRADLDLDALPADLPSKTRKLLGRCLERDPQRRLRDIGEARIALDDTVAGRGAEEPAAAPEIAPASTSRTGWIVAGIAILLAVAILVWHLWPSAEPPRRVVRLNFDSTHTGSAGFGRLIAISPDGSMVASSGAGSGDDVVFLRRLDEFEAKPVPAATSAYLPFFSPDSQRLGFVSSEGVFAVNLSGGPPVRIGDTPSFPSAVAWSEDGFIYLTSGGSLWRLPASGGEVEKILAREDAPGWLFAPMPLPGGRTVLVSSGESQRQQQRLHAFDAADRTLTDVGLQGADPRYLPTGHLLFAAGDQVMAVGFDAGTVKPVGTPVPVLERVLVSENNIQMAVSNDGTVAYLPRRPGETARLLLVDRDGVERPVVTTELPFADSNDPRFSPDGMKLAVQTTGNQLWVIDLESETPTHISDNGFYPAWSPDSKTLYYGSTRGESFDLYRRAIDMSVPEEMILDVENNLRTGDCAPDGSLVFREEVPGKGMDLMVWPDPADPSSFKPLLEGPEDELSPEVSPDGKWLAYVSPQSGRDEVFVTTFPEPSGRVQVSVAGGNSPTWSPDMKELFYFERSNFIAVQIETEPGFRVVRRDVLFQGAYAQYRWQRQYDIHPEGDLFAMVINPASGNAEIILNWFVELEAAVPSGK